MKALRSSGVMFFVEGAPVAGDAGAGEARAATGGGAGGGAGERVLGGLRGRS